MTVLYLVVPRVEYERAERGESTAFVYLEFPSALRPPVTATLVPAVVAERCQADTVYSLNLLVRHYLAPWEFVESHDSTDTGRGTATEKHRESTRADRSRGKR